jgi:hypothetical protein
MTPAEGQAPARSPVARRALLILAVVLAGLVLGLPRAPAPSAEEASYLPLVESLWHDHDLRFERADLARGLERWTGGPRGVALTASEAGGTAYYARPLAYPLAALPFYALFGERGLLLLNALLGWLAAALLAAGWAGAKARPETRRAAGLPVGWWLGGVLATALAAYFFQARAEPFVAVCLLAAVWLWRRHRSHGGAPEEAERRAAGWPLVVWPLVGALTAAAVVHERWLLPVAVVIVADLLVARAWRPTAALVLAGLLVSLALLGLAHRLAVPAGAGRLETRFFDSWPVALDPAAAALPPAAAAERQRRAAWQRALPASGLGEAEDSALPGAMAARADGWRLAGLGGVRRLPRNALSLVAGRYSGLLPYFPFALLALLAALPAALGGRARDDGAQRWLLGALLATLALLAWLGPELDAAPVAALGDRRLAMLSPLFLLLAGRRGRWLTALGWLAAGLWTLPAVLGAVSPLNTAPRARHLPASDAVAARLLPLELHLAAAARLPGYAARWWPGGALWLVPRGSVFVAEGHPNGAWVRGDSRSELILVAREPQLDLPLTLHALGDVTARLDTGAETLRVRFDSLAKRQGTQVRLAMRPVALLPSPFTPEAGELVYYYRLELTVEGGTIAMLHDPANADRRFLGIFLDLTGEGP